MKEQLMNPLMNKLMAEAMALTRRGDLQAATAAIQSALRQGPHGAGNPLWEAARGQADQPASSTSAARADDAQILDGLTRWVDEAPAAPPAPDPGPSPQAWTRGRFAHAGREITYRLFTPDAAMNPSARRPMIVMLHGCTQDADDFAAGTRMNVLAREQGFVVLYPEQAQRGNAQKCWNWFKPQHQTRERGEPAVIAALSQSIIDAHQVDPSRVYVAGLSAGGAMADILGRAYPDLFAAVGVHSGLATGAARDLPSALAAMRSGAEGGTVTQQDAPPTIVFHGDADFTVHPSNGQAVVRACTRTGARTQTAPQIDHGSSQAGQRYTCTRYRAPDGSTRVAHWLLHGAGHAWSGGSAQGSYTHPGGVDASAEMVRFFMTHRLGGTAARV